MNKKVLIVLISACVLGFAFSSCSSDEREESVDAYVKVFCVHTDHISDVVNDEYGVVCRDYFDGNMYIDAANGNRYYLAATGEFLNEIQPMLEKEGILVEGNNVKFSGKVYDSDNGFLLWNGDWRIMVGMMVQRRPQHMAYIILNCQLQATPSGL